jgi:hypothetical protein
MCSSPARAARYRAARARGARQEQDGADDFPEHLMRVILGFFSGLVGMLAGWAGLAFLMVAFAGPDRDGGVAMGAFFTIGPFGAVVGFAVGIFLFVKFGLVARPVAPAAQPLPSAAAEPASAPPGAAATPGARRISRPFAAVLLVIVGTLAWWGWYEFIRSPYLTHGYMTLALQFRLPENVAAPADTKDVQILLDEGGNFWPAGLSERGWRGHQGSRVVILATVSMSYKARRRTVTLSMPEVPPQAWTLDLPSDPDPSPGYTDWLPSSNGPDAIELSYRLTADR